MTENLHGRVLLNRDFAIVASHWNCLAIRVSLISRADGVFQLSLPWHSACWPDKPTASDSLGLTLCLGEWLLSCDRWEGPQVGLLSFNLLIPIVVLSVLVRTSFAFFHHVSS